jgi:hypothetical protein
MTEHHKIGENNFVVNWWFEICVVLLIALAYFG